MEGAWEAMSQIIIQQEDERQLDTIRVRVIEWSNWRQGWRKACKMWTKGSRECWNHQKCVEAHEDVQKSRNQVAEVGFEYFCLDYVSKMEWVLWNVTVFLSWFAPWSSMSLRTLASTSDGSTHFQHFQIDLWPHWVVSLLLILSHRLSYVSIILLYLILSILLLYIWPLTFIPDFGLTYLTFGLRLWQLYSCWHSGNSSAWSLRITTVSGMFPITSFPCICYRTEDYHCVSVSHLFGSPLS